MSYQDWNPVILNKSKPSGSKAGGSGGGSGGHATADGKKIGAGGNRQHRGPENAAKLEAEDEVFRHKTVSMDTRRRIQQARVAKEWSQADLAKAINEKPSVVNDYESGKAVPNNQILQKLEKALGCKLHS